MGASDPLVSVIVPNYNHARYLEQRIDSVLGQSFRDFELILLDDASTDDSRGVIARYTDRPGVRFEPNAVNSGTPFAQWNRGVSLARGRYVWLAESDDFAAPTLLEALVPLLERDASAVVAYCDSQRVDADGRHLGVFTALWADAPDAGRWRQGFRRSGREECADQLIWKNTIPNASAVLFRRDAYRNAGGAPTTMRLCGDWMLWARLLQHGNVAYVPEPLNHFRQHAGSVRARTAELTFLQEQWRTQSFICAHCPVSSATVAQLTRQTVDALLDQVLPRPPGKRWPTFRQSLDACGPILRRRPFVTIGAVASRYGRGFRRRFDRPRAIER